MQRKLSPVHMATDEQWFAELCVDRSTWQLTSATCFTVESSAHSGFHGG